MRPASVPAGLLLACLLGMPVPLPASAQDSTSGLSPELVAPGVSRELARHRAATLSDLTYDLTFRVPADAGVEVSGEVTIGFRRSDRGPLILDFAEPGRVRGVHVQGRPVDFDAVHTHLVIPGETLPDGRGSVTVEFVAGDAPLNRRDAFLYTLFVPDRAHEAFPSFDQPDLKARFRLRLTVPAAWTAVANGAVEAREVVGDEATYRFAETAPLPTYLFAFAAGAFQVEEAERAGRRLRLFHRETDEEKVARNRDAIFDLHAAALAWLEEYTGIPYPFGKFDAVAIPSFQYNGMEHPGAILYRASSLFLDESATRNQELGRASVIAHETAHMWFGDLVTMRWFDDVWMKEVFANFMAAKIVNPSFPDIDHELRFLLAHYPAAYSVDRTAGANPIRQPLENLDDAGSLYGAIIYQKAPIVMRQLERLAGGEAFRTALRAYLADHAFGNAGWPELVAALDAVTSMDVPGWSRVWIEEPGRPTFRVETVDGVVTALTQSDPRGRGLLWDQVLQVKLRGAGELGGSQHWYPVGLRADRFTLEVDSPFPPDERPSRTIALPNGLGLGYGLFLLDDVTTAFLLDSLPGLPEPLDRAVAWIDLWEMMLEGAVSPAAMVELARRVVGTESDELVAQEVLGDLTTLYWRYLDEAERAGIARDLERDLWNRMEAVEGTSLKAAYFNAWRSVATTPPAVERMRAVWSGEREVEGLPISERDRTALALQLGVRGVEDARALLDAQAAAIENPDRRERFAFVRQAVAVDPAERDAFFASLADPDNRAREEWVVSALSLLHHPLRADDSVRYIRPALDLLLEVRETGDIFFPTRWLAATLGGHASPEAARIVQRFIDEHPDYPHRLMGKLLQEADPLFRAVRLRDG